MTSRKVMTFPPALLIFSDPVLGIFDIPSLQECVGSGVNGVMDTHDYIQNTIFNSTDIIHI